MVLQTSLPFQILQWVPRMESMAQSCLLVKRMLCKRELENFDVGEISLRRPTLLKTKHCLHAARVPNARGEEPEPA